MVSLARGDNEGKNIRRTKLVSSYPSIKWFENCAEFGKLHSLSLSGVMKDSATSHSPAAQATRTEGRTNVLSGYRILTPELFHGMAGLGPLSNGPLL